MAEDYRLVPVDEVPATAASGRRGIYARLLADFVASDMKAAKVEMPDRKPRSVHVSLLTWVRKSGLKETVHVAKRGDDIYLERLK